MEIKYNELAPATKKSLKVDNFDDGSIVTFKILKKPTVARDQKGNEVLIYPRSVRVPNTDVVYDPNSKKDNVVNIGYITGYDRSSGQPRFGEIEFIGAKMGAITLNTKKPSDIPLINYLRSCNYNKSNPLADKPVEGFKFEELKPVLTAKEKLKAKKQRAEVEAMILKMDNAMALTYLKSLRERTYNSVEENVMALTEYVQSPENLAKFLALSTDTKLPIAELVSEAITKKIIEYSSSQDSWIYSSTKKIIVQVAPGQDENEFLVEWLYGDTRGEAVREYLEKQLNKDRAEEELKAATVVLED